MKKIRFILTALLATAMAFATGCGDDNATTTEGGVVLGKQEVVLNSSISTRATGNTWDAGDEIGVYMVENGQPISSATAVYANKKYVTTGDGSFDVPSGQTKMFYPAGDETVDFVAYYPYTAAVSSDNKIVINVESQTDLAAIDLMSSTRVSGSETNKNVTLDFTHRLSNIVIEAENTTGVSYSDLTVKLVGLKTKSEYTIGGNTLSDDNTSVKDIVVPAVKSGDVFTAKAIVLPAGTVSASIVFEFTGGESYTWPFDASQTFVEGKRYTFEFKLGTGGAQQISPGITGSIEDWTDIPGGGPVGLNPEGTGSQASPFTVAQAKSSLGTTDKWVRGYIIGTAAPTLSKFSSDVRFLIADRADETDVAKQALIKITDDDIAKWFDFTTKATELKGLSVKILGTISAGNDVAVVIDNVTDHEGGIQPDTPAQFTDIKDVTTAWVKDQIIADGIKIKGTVVSDGASQNLSFSTVILMDGTDAGSGITLYGMTKDDYAVGTTLEIDLSGAKYTEHNGLRQVTVTAANTVTEDAAVTPTAVTVTDPSTLGTYISMLVTVPDAQAVYTEGTMNAQLDFVAGGTSFVVYNRAANQFKTTPIPTGKGSITGTVSVFNGTYQLVPRNAADFAGMTATRDGAIAFGTAVFDATKINEGELIENGSITIPYNNNPAAGSFTVSVTASIAGIDPVSTTFPSVQGSGELEIPITGTPTASGTATFTIAVDTHNTSVTATVNPSGTPQETILYTTGLENSDRDPSATNSYTVGPRVYTIDSKQWSLSYADLASSGNPLNGSWHFIGRIAKNTSNVPTYTLNEDITATSFTKITLKAKVSNAEIGMRVKISTDSGVTWNAGTEIPVTTVANDYEVNITATGKLRIMFESFKKDGTNVTTARDSNIDDIAIYGIQ